MSQWRVKITLILAVLIMVDSMVASFQGDYSKASYRFLIAWFLLWIVETITSERQRRKNSSVAAGDV